MPETYSKVQIFIPKTIPELNTQIARLDKAYEDLLSTGTDPDLMRYVNAERIDAKRRLKNLETEAAFDELMKGY
jgi:hypothetical protein